jgi:hypothetical protein
MGWLDLLNNMFGPGSSDPDHYHKMFEARMAKEQKEKEEIFDMSKNVDQINARLKKHNISYRMEEDSKRFEGVREERRKEEKGQDDLKLVIDTAKLQCDLCTNPIGDLKVNYDTPSIQGKKTATVKEKDMKSLIFKGNCKKSPQSSSPCASVMQLGDWKNVGDMKVQEQFPLLLKSTIKCNYGGTDIKITDCGQRNEPTDIKSLLPNNVPDFDITFELDRDQETVVPFGILDFENKAENPFFSFKYTLSKSKIDSMNFQILDEDDTAIYQMYYIKPVIVKASKKPEILFEAKKPTEGPLISKTWDYQRLYREYALFEPDDYTQIGEYYIHWDGFDNEGIYDSTRFNNKKLKAKITATKDGVHKHIVIDFATEYSQVNWTDVKIDRKAKRIDVTLRVNLTDGGENGLTCQTINASDIYKIPARTVCDWDKIPQSEINPSNPIIKTRTRTFEELKQLAFRGLEHYWGRNKSRVIGNHVNINGNYEVYIQATDSTKNALNSLQLVYNTNGDWMRSGNPGGSYFDESLADNILDSFPDAGVIQRLSYNVGYIYEYHYLKTWEYQNYNDEDKNFEETAAHELGHELLQAYGGTAFSWQHKGSSYYFPQDKKPLKGKETTWEYVTHRDKMTETSGENYPISGEVDLMKYYNNDTIKDKLRTIASEKDVLGLIWLTKIKIK